jgi:hypothetical protein
VELITGLIDNLVWQCAVMFDFFKRTLSPLQAEIICKVYAAHASMTNNPANFIAISKDFSSF